VLARDGKTLDSFMWWCHTDNYIYLCEKHAKRIDDLIEKMKEELTA